MDMPSEDTLFRPDRDTRLVIRRVCLAHESPAQRDLLYDVACGGGIVTSISKSAEVSGPTASLDGASGLLLPSLAHAHVHLDKCYILDRCDELIDGDFQEALAVTEKAKARFPKEDDNMYARGRRLIMESVACGVTAMRAHVEIDTTVGFTCFDVGMRLRTDHKDTCDVQIAVFAQEPLDSSAGDEADSKNLKLLSEAASRPGVSVVGSAPYVEPSRENARRNIARILDIAEKHSLHADFHLDYNLDPHSEILLYDVISQLRARSWGDSRQQGKQVTIGHATRLALMPASEWKELRERIAGLPIHFVGLPQSDLYMMGRNPPEGQLPVRGTLRVPQLAREHGIEVAMAVNNVDNAFTPQGSVDPLMLCPLGVAVFQAATTSDCRTLLSSVTLAAKKAIGIPVVASALVPSVGDPADFVILHGNTSCQSAALNPSYDRTTIKAGVVVAKRRGTQWVLGGQAR